MNIAICIATFRRPRLLARLLESINCLEIEPDIAPKLSVIVVDNDAAAPARKVVEAARPGFRWSLAYTVEPVRNISRARNRGVKLALAGGATFVAFVDDDEEADPAWLGELLRVQAAFAADVVQGRIVPRIPEQAPRWMRHRDFFGRGSGTTGSRVAVADTGNALVAAWLLAAHPGPFEPRFGLSGGGDSHFFQRARMRGAKIVCANDAIVVENIPPDRATAQWILKRAFRVGNHSVLVERELRPLQRWLPARLVKSSGRIALGMLMLAVSPLQGRAAAVAALRNVGVGLGAYAGILGFRVIAYGTVDGD